MKVKKYLTDTLDGMGKGLFASLVIGVILSQIGTLLNFNFLINLGKIAQFFMGPSIGIAIGYKLKVKQFTLVSSGIVGALGAGTVNAISNGSGAGEPVGAFIAVIISIEIGKLIEDKTNFNLFLVPGAMILTGGIISLYISPYISSFLSAIGNFISYATNIQPALMGILLGTSVGMILTSPISSAAICIAIGINGLAAGAALAGCCGQMIGFAVSSFKENKFSGLIALGIGTSKLEIPNIIKNPLIWIPPTIASAICGLLATTIFSMKTTSVGAGMGSAGLVGQFTTYSIMGSKSLFPILILHFIIPSIIVIIISNIMRKKGLIKENDMKLI